jgi:hypothetical protein
MAMPRKLPVDFNVAFPHGAYLVSEVVPVTDFNLSTADKKIQQIDPDTSLPMWAVEVVDADPEAKKAFRTLSVKFAAKVQPVPPPNDGASPFTPVVFEGLTALPYIEEVGENFRRIAWSFRADAMNSPGGRAAKPSAGDSKAAA